MGGSLGWGWGWEAWAWSPSTVPFLHQTRGPGHYLSQNLPFTSRTNPKRRNDLLKITQWMGAGVVTLRRGLGAELFGQPLTPHQGLRRKLCCGMTHLGFHSTDSKEKQAGRLGSR